MNKLINLKAAAAAAIMALASALTLLVPQPALAAQTITSATLNGGSSVVVKPGTTITANVVGSLTGGDHWHGTQWRISTTPPSGSGTSTCSDTTDHNSGTGVSSGNFNITAPGTAGTYNVYFIMDSSSICNGSEGAYFTLSNAVVVDATAPTITITPGDSTSPVKTVTWNWSANEASTYRYIISTNPATMPSGSFSSVTSATQSTGNGTYYLKVEAQDAAGNTTVKGVYAILDNTAPVIAPASDVIATANALGGATVSYALPTATDNHDSTVTVTCSPVSGSFFSLGQTTVTCNASDAAGNAATPVTFKVTVNPGPVSASQSTVEVSVSSATTNGGNVIITITAKDQFGNVIPNILPANVVISASGSGNTVHQPSAPTDSNGKTQGQLGSSVSGTKTITVTINGTPLTQQPQVTFTVGDPVNATVTATPKPREASLSGASVALDIFVDDGNGNAVNDGVILTVTPSTSAPHGTPTVTGCTPTSAGHVSCTLSFNYKGTVSLAISSYKGSLNVLGDNPVSFVDTTKPIIAVIPPNPDSVEYKGTYTDPGATATDNIDGDLTSQIVKTGTVDPNTLNGVPNTTTKVVGVYTLYYNVSDSSTNAAVQQTRTVNVVDTTPPVIESITSDATASGWLKVTDSITFTLTTSVVEPAGTIVSGSYNGRSLTWTTTDNRHWTAVYTVTEGDSDQLTPLQISGVKVTDEAGNDSTLASGIDVQKTIDANTPTTPTVNLPTYINNAGKSNVELTISGESGTTADYALTDSGTGSVTGSVVIPGTGTAVVNLDLSGLADGTVTASVTLTDVAGNKSPAGTDTATKDTVAPAAGTLTIDPYINVTNQSPFAVNGTGEPNAKLHITITDFDGHTEIIDYGAVTVGGNIYAIKNLSSLHDGTVTFALALEDAAGNVGPESTTTAVKETIRPTLVSLDNGSLYKAGTYTLSAEFSEDVTAPKISIAYTSVNGTCSDVTNAAMTPGSDALHYTYDLVIDDACDGANATITVSNATDTAGNPMLDDATHTFKVDTLAPALAITSPATDAYINANYSVSYTMSEDLQSGSLVFHSMTPGMTCPLTGSDLLSGTHTIAAVALTTCGITLTEGTHTITLNGTDLAGNSNTTTNTNITYDVTAPTVVNVTSPKADGIYKAGEVIDVTVQFSEPVNVTYDYTSGGCGYWPWSPCWDGHYYAPQVALETGSTDRNAVYDRDAGGSGTNTISFRYVVEAGDMTSDLDYISASALSMNGQSIRDLAGNDVVATLAVPGAEHSLGFNKAIVIDTQAPTVALTTPVADPTNVTPFTVTATFSEDVTGFESSDIVVGNGSVSNFAGSGSVYTFDVTPTGDGSVTIDVPAAAAVDAAGNGNTVATQLTRVFDATKPTVTAVALMEGTVASDGLVKAGDVLTVNVTFSEDMASTPVPQISIAGANTLTGADMTKVDAKHYTYNFTVGSGDGTATITIDNGKDLAGNAQVANSSATFKVDNTAPVISGTPSSFATTANTTGYANGVTYTMPTAADDVDGSVAVTCTPASGSNFPLGGTTVTCTAKDAAGNNATPTTFTVTVNPAVIAKVTVSASPSTLTTADTSTLTINGRDQYDNVTTNQSGTVVAISADNGGALGATIVTLASGAATTSLNKTSAGDVHVTVTSGILTPGNTTVTFTKADVTPPTVVNSNPAPGATGVSVNASLFVTFSEPLKSTSINSTNVQLWRVATGTEVSDVQIPVTVSLVSGDMQVNLTPAGPLEYTNSYYFVVSGVQDAAGNAMADPYTTAGNPFKTEDSTADVTNPTVKSQYPAAAATNVAITVKPSVTFSETMDTTTLTDSNVQLIKDSDSSVIPATVVVGNGGTQAILEPATALLNSTSYHVTVSTAVKDLAGNPLASSYVGDSFTTEAEQVVDLAVTQTELLQSYATPNNTYASGWKWKLKVTTPKDETKLRMKFTDFTSGANTVPAAGNIHFYSAQSSDAATSDTAREITAAGTFSSDITLNGDTDTSAPGRQIEIIVEVKVPAGTPGGSYSNSYDIQTSTPSET